MRTLNLIGICLGLALIAVSWREIGQVRQYQVLVGAVQTTANSLYDDALKLVRTRMSILVSPSMKSVLSELDSVKSLERGWWVAGSIGCAACVMGLAGLVLSFRRRAANNTLQATAATRPS